MTAAVVLASASPRRRELLERVGLVLEVRPADVDETPAPGEAPAAYVARVARDKARATPRRAGEVVVAADTTVTIDGAILAKAADEAEAAAMLRRLGGRAHEVLTGYCVIGPAGERAEVVATTVRFVPLDDALLAGYLASGEWRGKAGAYAIQGIGAALVRAVEGSVTGVIGLPLVEVLAAVRAVGGPAAPLAAGRPA